jgi:predicted kinase
MIYVVSGAPCSGKSTYIRENAKPGSVVIDMDRIALALTTEGTEHHDYSKAIRSLAMTTRKTAVKKAMTLGAVLDVWVIDTAPTQESKAMYSWYKAKHITLNPPLEEIMQRIEDNRPEHLRGKLRKLAMDYYLNGIERYYE